LLVTFSATNVAPVLPTQIVIGVLTGMPMKMRIWTTRMLSFASPLKAMCSASEEERATMLACFECHTMGTPHENEMTGMADFLLPLSFVQSEPHILSTAAEN